MSKQIILEGSTVVSSAGTKYWGLVGGLGPKSTNNSNEVISAAGTIRNLKVIMLSAPGSGTSYQFNILKNGSAIGTPTVTISDTSTEGSDTSTNLSVSPGDDLVLQTISSGAVTTSYFKYTFEFEGTTAKETNLIGFFNSATVTQGSNQYGCLNGSVGIQTIAARATQMVAGAGTMKNLYVILKAAPGAGESISVELYVNGVASGVITTISGTSTSGSDTSNTKTVSAGDYVYYEVVTSAGCNTSAVPRWGITWLANTDGESLVMGGNADRNNKTVIEYNNLNGSGINWNATEANANVLGQANGNTVTISDLYVRLTDGAITSGDYTFTARKNGAATSLTAQITSRIANDTSNSFTIADGDLLALECLPSTGTLPSAVRRVGWGALMTVEAAAVSSTLTGVLSLTGISTLTF